ncbi:MAG: competence protein ComK [Thermovenabulum sp.]|uniref:competence protein ComK n=1 Tax=Thermovenabulum sp. TaxID=3100335 RepID=UPI003C79B41B
MSSVSKGNFEKYINQGIAAIIPVYQKDLGNASLLILKSGEEILVKKTVKTLISKMARHFGKDVALLRNEYGKAVNKRNGVPLPLSSNYIMIPVKFREKPHSLNDGTLGYISFYEIERVKEKDKKRSIVSFKSGKEVDVFLSTATINSYLKDARLISKIQEDKENMENKLKVIKFLSELFSKPS